MTVEQVSDCSFATSSIYTGSENSAANSRCTTRCNVLTTSAEFQQLKCFWDRCSADPLSSFAWNFSWWNAFSDCGRLRLLEFQRDGVTVGVAPLYVDRWFGLERLRFLASGDACTDYVDLICEPEYYDLCASLLADWVRDQGFDTVELEGTRDDRLALLTWQLLQTEYQPELSEIDSTWRLELPDSWDQFKSTAKKSLRRKITKAEKRLKSDEFDFRSTRNGMPVAEAFAILKELHQQRISGKGETGVFSNVQFDQFLRNAVLELSKNNGCEIIVVMHGQQPIGAQLYLDSQSGFQLYQSGYAPDAMHLEPGHLLFTAMIRRAIDRGDRCFDFLRGNESYKAFWGATTCPQNKWRLVSKRKIPRMVAQSVEWIRRLVRRG